MNFPGTTAAAIDLEKGKEMEGYSEGLNDFVLQRVKLDGPFMAGQKKSAQQKPAAAAGPPSRWKPKPAAVDGPATFRKPGANACTSRLAVA